MVSNYRNPFNSKELILYLREIRHWHGYIRFLGLPHLRDESDIAINSLYVEPFFSSLNIDPEDPPEVWPLCLKLQKILDNYQRIVLLGDPGSGKSTLINWLACQFAQPKDNILTRKYGRLIPIPFAIRELNITSNTTWDSLFDSFLSQAVAEPLRNFKNIETLFESGQAFFLIDGLDELGELSGRIALRAAILEAEKKYPKCCFLLTSRIIGYEQVSYSQYKNDDIKGSYSQLYPSNITDHDPSFDISDDFNKELYLAPFKNNQIKQFSKFWYLQREKNESIAIGQSEDFYNAIITNKNVLHLSRTPSLLALMALIYRIEARLPNGRALLYDRISTAYLESIDLFRGIKEVNYDLTQKKRWLSYVGFMMQAGRGFESNKRELLVIKNKLIKWISNLMYEEGFSKDRIAAEKYIDYIGRRSGLLIPRSEQKFAFVHLSFQEYFAASYLKDKIMSPYWILDKSNNNEVEYNIPLGARKEDVIKYSKDPNWANTIYLLFELLSSNPAWSNALFDSLYEKLFNNNVVYGPEDISSLELLAEISTDPHSGLAMKRRMNSWELCWSVNQIYTKGQNAIHINLLKGDELFYDEIVNCLINVAVSNNIKELNLAGSLSIKDLFPFGNLIDLEKLDLSFSFTISNFAQISKFKNLKQLILKECDKLTDISQFRSLNKLEYLDISWCLNIRSFTPISKLTSLKELVLSNSNVSDLSFLKTLNKLEFLSINNCREIKDLTPLLSLNSLKNLDIKGISQVASNAPIKILKKTIDVKMD